MVLNEKPMQLLAGSFCKCAFCGRCCTANLSISESVTDQLLQMNVWTSFQLPSHSSLQPSLSLIDSYITPIYKSLMPVQTGSVQTEWLYGAVEKVSEELNTSISRLPALVNPCLLNGCRWEMARKALSTS